MAAPEIKASLKPLLSSEYPFVAAAARRITGAAEMLGEPYDTAVWRVALSQSLLRDISPIPPVELGPLGPVLAALFDRALEDAALGDAAALYAKAVLLQALSSLLSGGTTGPSARELLQSYRENRAAARAARDMDIRTGKSGVRMGILQRFEKLGEDALYGYGLPVAPEEIELARYLRALPRVKRMALARRIVEGMLHGFYSQNRERRGRDRVLVCYALGQEPLVLSILDALREQNLSAVVQCNTSRYAAGLLLSGHGMDDAAALQKSAVDAYLNAYWQEGRSAEDELGRLCGYIRLDPFSGRAKGPPADGYIPTAEERAAFVHWKQGVDAIDEHYLTRNDLSYTRTALPDPSVGPAFPQLMEGLWQILSTPSGPYERIQQTIIEALDTCTAAHLVGTQGNDTDLWVSFQPLQNPQTQSNFLNCGGDLNIPHGEVFTTPLLTGTRGVLHVEDITLDNVTYKNLRLEFEDGVLTHYTCGNPVEDKAAFILSNLLEGRESVPIGEFAIGTNTALYALLRRSGPEGATPPVFEEKLGPHIALGDPCFARGEDSPVYNLIGRKKEVTARENERTAKRGGEGEVYTYLHIDITLPYHHTALLEGIRADGTRFPILQNGRYVLPGCEELNEYLNLDITHP